MKNIDIIDSLQKKVNSILFRFILILNSIAVLILYGKDFDWYVYISVFFIYMSIYVFFFQRSIGRLINDFIFINFIVYGKDVREIVVFFYIFLPVLNSINFSGNKKSFLLYFATVFTYFVQLFVFNHNNFNVFYDLNNYTPLLVLLFMYIINSYSNSRDKIRKFREELSYVVDNFYLKRDEMKKPHKIYNKIIDVIHQNNSKIEILDIFCFTIIGDVSERLVIVNGSKFIWNFNFENAEIIKSLREKSKIINADFSIEGKKYNTNLVFYTKVEDREYVYIFLTSRNLPIYYVLIDFFSTLKPILNKISSILLTEKNLHEFRNTEILRLSERSQYVNRANKTMHYIRNRLGPFSNLIQLLEGLELAPSDKVSDFKDLISSEAEYSKIELQAITDRANKMLEKNSNPFVFTKLIEVPIEKVFVSLNRNFLRFFPNFEILIALENQKEKKYVFLNEEGFDLFLSDWLNNMAKYRKEFVSCSFSTDENSLTIIFSNDHSLNKSELENLISDLNSDDRNEIMKRTTHGLYNIKLTLEDMKIPYKSYTNNEKLVLELTFKLYSNENSSI